MGVKRDPNGKLLGFSKLISSALALLLALSPVPKTMQSYSSSMIKSLKNQD